mmetsp:Transcript_22232/g.26702  ORF Transcript_22232/g.26702 Transcript_22232/m.26702 type:complete len:347 (+) Transcript_22232:267-1307(+)|eukprot:CAMPEP_0197849774 /NCGR_PEP_ID=MMETSP1438-20131217/13172_1 /TAXON_ID=1461541 /ORGANISM="Pterosperma sp., Strain CCMP1384" /LENGTH=346 /DNA_ID=CAMNT_0043462611 /DNA_START=264 /DNA_END=1304 /DNA_ORIENTATION=+
MSDNKGDTPDIVVPQEDDYDGKLREIELAPVDNLAELLTLTPVGEDRYAGPAFAPWYTTRTFGGVTMAQAIVAAALSVEAGRLLHSFHGYFLRAGDADATCFYHVKNLRDGQSFSNRRVQAIQNGQVIFELQASFQVRSAGQKAFEHQIQPRPAPSLEECKPYTHKFRFIGMPGEVRHSSDCRDPSSPFLSQWFKADFKGHTVDKQIIHCATAAFFSDVILLSVATMPHAHQIKDRRHLRTATLCHSMYFHHNFRTDDWILHEMTSPNASDDRGLCFGHMYNKEGLMVATCIQEGLIRHDPSKKTTLLKESVKQQIREEMKKERQTQQATKGHTREQHGNQIKSKL